MTKIKLRARLESTDEQWVKDQAFERFGVESIKVGYDGWPDRLYFIPGGRPLWIEHKRHGEAPKPEDMTRQQYRIQCLRDWGYDAEMIDDRDQALEKVRRAVEAAQVPGKRRRPSRR